MNINVNYYARPLYNNQKAVSLNRAIDDMINGVFNDRKREFSGLKPNGLYNYNVAIYSLGTRNTQKALDCFIKAIKINDWGTQNEYECRINCMNQIAKLVVRRTIENVDAETLYDVGCRLTDLGNFQGALQIFKKLPYSAYSYYNQGICYYYLGDLDKALDCFTQTVHTSDRSWNSESDARRYQDQACCYAADIFIKKAGQSINEAERKDLRYSAVVALLITSEPKNGGTSFRIASLYEEDGKPKQAIDWYRECLKNTWSNILPQEIVNFKRIAESKISDLNKEDNTDLMEIEEAESQTTSSLSSSTTERYESSSNQDTHYVDKEAEERRFVKWIRRMGGNPITPDYDSDDDADAEFEFK